MSIFTINLSTYHQELNVSSKDKLEYGEIYTPFTQINKMFDLFEPDVFEDSSKTWLDVGSGLGYFMIILFDRLNNGLSTKIPDENERKTHIIENMLYMIEIKENNVMALREMFGKNANIFTINFCEYEYEDASMPYTFDYIIGNPPYNSGGIKKVPTNKNLKKTQEGHTIWRIFIIKIIKILENDTGQLCIIIPSIWLKQDKEHIHNLLTRYKIEKLHALSSNETNALFKGNAQTPTCYFLMTKKETDNKIALFDKNKKKYEIFEHTIGRPIPVFGVSIINKLQRWVKAVGCLNVKKTNMPSVNSCFTENINIKEYPYCNIKTCVLEKLQPVLLMNYSNIPQKYYGVKKIVLAHKMYGFPYFDKHGTYGISNRDNYVIINKSDKEFMQLQAFLSTKFVLYLFESARYHMKYLEKYAFEFIPDITNIDGFPVTDDISDDSVAKFFELSDSDKIHIQELHKKNYKKFI
jgi:tRNA1(Val) A37 N6-methylase TrmN6